MVKSATIFQGRRHKIMAGEGLQLNNFESSVDKADDSKDKTKSKKKKSAEAAPPPETDKKESFADRFKAIGTQLFEDKPEKAAKKDKTESTTPDKPETPASENVAEHDEETSVETEPLTAEETEAASLTAEEIPEVDERLKAAKIEELQEAIDASDDEVEIAANQAAIDMLEDMPAIDAGETDDKVEAAPEHQTVPFETADEPLPFEDEAAIPLAPTAPAASGGSRGGSTGGTSGGSSGSGRSGSLPPMPPLPAPAPRPPLGPPNVPNFNRPPAANVAPAEYQPDYRVNPNRSYLLVGGIVGYLIGRRRGRIKTEKRMNVVVKKLEQQVEAKQRIIDRQVEVVKQRTRQEYWDNKATRREMPAAIKQPETKSQPRRSESVPIAATQELRRDARTERKPVSPERAAERTPTSVEMRDEDIVRLSETITVGATNLKKIYEAKLITDGGLRRLVSEHLQGKDLRRGLAREFLTKELSYERDPRFRDIVPVETKGPQRQAGSTAGQPVGQDLALSTAGTATEPTSNPTPAVPKSIPVKQARTSVSTGILTLLSFIALALAAYAVWLGLTH